MFRLLTICFVLLFTGSHASAQLIVQGTIFDAGMANYVEGVRVVSTSGVFAITDTLGHYSIPVREDDSLCFVYNNKPTIKFPVKDITDPTAFNISIKAKVATKYKVLKEVVVYSKSYKEDSIENRETYSGFFNYQKPGLYTSSTGDGVAFDLDQIINVFRFNRNKRLKAFQEHLLEEEQEKYINARFGKVYVSRITRLKGNELDSFMIWYRPTYAFCINSNELDFIQYLLRASDHFRVMEGLPARREDQ
jgi:hypothetical protein